MIEAKGKHLTIDDITKNIEMLFNEIDKELSKKKVKFGKTQPTSLKVKEIVVNSTIVHFDKFLKYTIASKEIDETVKEKIKSLEEYQKLLLTEIQNKERNDYKQTILYFRNKGYSWKQIHRLFLDADVKYSIRHIRRIANE